MVPFQKCHNLTAFLSFRFLPANKFSIIFTCIFNLGCVASKKSEFQRIRDYALCMLMNKIEKNHKLTKSLSRRNM